MGIISQIQNRKKRDEEEKKAVSSKAAPVKKSTNQVQKSTSPKTSITQPKKDEGRSIYFTNKNNYVKWENTNKTGRNYSTKDRSKWTAPEAAAYGSISGDSSVFSALSTSSNDRSSQFYNPYRGGQPVLPEGAKQFFKDNWNYEGKFDQDFVDTFRGIYGDQVNLTDSMSVSKPGKKSSADMWGGYYYNLIAKNVKENNDTNNQFSEYKKALSDYFDDFTKINGRNPTYQEFIDAVDRSKYSKLTNIDDSLNNFEKTAQILPSGTFYSPEIIPGLYYAKLHGDDINVDRDFFLDAKAYAMDPVQETPSIQKYAWSNDDLSSMSQDDSNKYLSYLYANGNHEEAAAFRYALWAAQPDKPDSISVEPSILQSAIGFYKDENWFNEAFERFGKDYSARLKQDHTMKNLDSNSSYMDRACRELYEANQLRDKTNEVEDAYTNVLQQIQDVVAGIKDWEEIPELSDVADYIKTSIGLDDNTVLKNYFKDGDNGNKYCRYMPQISEANIDAVINRVWEGGDVSKDVDYTALEYSDLMTPMGDDKPATAPLMYGQTQAAQAQDRRTNRNNADRQAAESVESFSDSGVPVAKGSVPVLTPATDAPEPKTSEPVEVRAEEGIVPSVLDSNPGRWVMLNAVNGGNKVLGWLANLWHGHKKEQYAEKLGPNVTPEQAAAIDPVLSQLDYENMPEEITGDEAMQIAKTSAAAKAACEEVTLADGIVENVLPGAEHLAEMELSDRYSHATFRAMLSKPFNGQVYKGVYEDRMANGYNPDDAAAIAYFSATGIGASIRAMTEKYGIDDELKDASNRLIQDITEEEGAKDTYEVMKTINDDVNDYVHDDDNDVTPEEADMTDFNTALLIGSSESADPAFRATTNKVIHDISTGDILPQDVIDGLNAFKGMSSTERAAFKITPEVAQDFLAEQEAANKKPFEAVNTALGTTLTYNEYVDTVLGEARSIMDDGSAVIDVDNLSEELKVAIDYPTIEAFWKQYHGNDTDILNMMVADSIDSLVHPDKMYNTNPELENSTDFLNALERFGEGRSDEVLSQNASKAAGNIFQRVLQMSADVDRFDILPTLFAFTLGEDESDLGKLHDLFTVYGKWFSRNEIDGCFAAVASGKATFDEAESLIMDRVNPTSENYVDERYISAISNPNALNQSFAGFDNGLSRLIDIYSNAPDNIRASRLLASGESLDTLREQYPDIAIGLDLPTLRDIYMTPEGLYDDEAFYNAAKEKLRSDNEREGLYDFDENQLNGLGDLVSFIKQCGPSGYILSYLDNDALKQVSNGTVDLDAAGLGDYNAGQLMSIINPDWGKPYGINPGSDNSLLYSGAGGFISGARKVASVPSYLLRLFAKVSEDTPFEGVMSSRTRDWANKSYDALKRIETKEAGLDQHVATKAEAFVRQGVSETVRNLISSAIGGKLAGYYADDVIESLAGMPVSEAYKGRTAIQALEVITENLGAKQYAVTIAKQLGRLPMYAGVFGREANDELDKGSTKAKALIKGGLSAAIESVTEDLGLEKATSIKINGIDLAEHALNSANNLGGLGAYFVINSARNVISEIGEEEVAEVLGRFVDMGEMMIQGEGAESAFWKSMEGLPEAAANTAVATAFSTLLFSAYDLGNLTYNYLNDCIINGVEPIPRAIIRNVEVDIAANMDENQEDESKPEEQTLVTEEQTQSAPESSADEAIEEELGSESTQKIERPAIEPQQQEITADQKTTQPATPFDPAKDIPVFQKRVQEAAKKAVLNASSEATSALKESMVALGDAIDKAKAVEAQEAAEQVMEPKQAIEPEQTNEAEQQPEPELSEGAKTIKNFMEQSESAIDNAITDKAGEIAAEEAVNNDPGIISAQRSLDELVQKAQKASDNVKQLVSEGQRMVGQMRQMFRAAVDESIDPTTPSAQTINAQWALQEKQSANAEETAKQQEALAALQEQADAKAKALEEDKQKKGAEVKAAQKKAAQKKLDDKRQKDAEEANKDPRQVAAEERLEQLNEDDERIRNARNAEARGDEVHSLYSNADYQANTEALQRESETRLEDYSAKMSDAYGPYNNSETTEQFVDPGTYKVKPVVEPERPDTWKDDRKQNEEGIIAEKERQDRMLGDFARTPEAKHVSPMVPVHREIFTKIVNAIKREYGDVKRYQAYMANASGDRATALGPTTAWNEATPENRTELSNEDSKNGINNSVSLPSETNFYSADKFVNGNGSVTALAYDILTAADPNFKTASYQQGKIYAANYADVATESDRYVILKRRNSNATDSAKTKQRLRDLTKKDANGKTALDRGRDQIRELQGRLERYQSYVNTAASRLADANKALDSALPDELKTAAQAVKDATAFYKNSERSVRVIQEQLNKAKERQFESEEFVANAPSLESDDTVYYIIDKSILANAPDSSETYRIAVTSATARMPSSDEILEKEYRQLILEHARENAPDNQDYAEALDKIIEDRFANSSDDDLRDAYFQMLLNDELKRLSADRYRGACKVIKGTETKAKAQVDRFVSQNGGYSAHDGTGFMPYQGRGYYDKNTSFFVSEDSIFKYLDQEEIEADTPVKISRAQYRAKVDAAIRRYGADNNLSDSDIEYLQSYYGGRKRSSRQIGTATVVTGNRTHLLGIPTKILENNDTNKLIRGEDGSFSIDLAMQRVENKIRSMMDTAESEDNNTPLHGAVRKLNTETDSIQVYWRDASGVQRSRKIGEFYTDADGQTKRFFPGDDQLYDSFDKIVCNFPVYYSKDGKKLKENSVNFTLFFDDNNDSTGQFNEARRASQSFDLESSESELGHNRGLRDLERDYKLIAEMRKKYSNKPDAPHDTIEIACLNAAYNYRKAQYKYALEHLKNATPDKVEYWDSKVKKFGAAIEDISARLSKAEQRSYGNIIQKDKFKNASSEKTQPEKRSEPEQPSVHDVLASYDPDQPDMALQRRIQRNYPRFLEGQSSPNASAQERYELALDRYRALTDPEGPFAELFNVNSFDHILDYEREMLQKILPILEKEAEQESSKNEAPTEAIQPASPKPESDIPAQLGDLEPETKLVVLKDLSDRGENVDAARTEAIKEYHDQQMEGMSSDERIDYLANQAKLAEENPDNPRVDPNTNYDAQLANAMTEEAKKNNKKVAKRLKSITKNAGTYKSVHGVNKALAEIDQMERDGMDVTEARDALNKRRDALTTPESVRREAVIESVEDPAFKMNLQMMSDSGNAIIGFTPDAVSDSLQDFLAAMRRPPDPDKFETGFEDIVNAVRTAGEYISSEEELKQAKDNLANIHVRIDDRTEGINSLKDAIRADKTLAEGIGMDLKDFEDSNGIKWTSAESMTRYIQEAVRFAKAIGQLADNADYRNDQNMANALTDDLNEIRAIMENIEKDNGFSLNDEQRAQYGNLHSRLKAITDKNIERKAEVDKLIAERAEAYRERDIESASISSSATAQKLAHDPVSFRLSDIMGKEEERMGTLMDGRKTAKTLASSAMKSFRKMFKVGYKTTFTPEQMAEVFKTIGLFDEKEMNYNHNIASDMSQALKERRIMVGLLDAAKSSVDKLMGRLTDEELAAKISSVKEELYKLHYMAEGNESGRMKRAAFQRDIDRRLNKFLDKVESSITGNNADLIYRTLDNQLTILNSQIEKASQAVDDWFSLSTPEGIADALRRKYGGHYPVQLIRMVVGLIMNNTNSENIKKGKGRHPIATYMNTFTDIVERTLGDGAALFKSIYINPVNEANANIARETEMYRKQLKTINLNKKERIILAHMLDNGWDEEYMIMNYGQELGDRLIEAAKTCRNITQTIGDSVNVAFARNGLRVTPMRANYFPHLRKEPNAFLRFLGINTTLDDIATGMIGHTDDTTPSHKFGPFEMERTKDTMEGMEDDPIIALQSYINYGVRAKYLTDSIVAFNDLIDAMGGRQTATGDAKADYEPSVLDYNDDGSHMSKPEFNTFIASVETYRNMLAGKKTSELDRGAEKGFARSFYDIVRGIQKIQGANKVGLNSSPIVANVIPVFTAAAINPTEFTKATTDTVLAFVRRFNGNDTENLYDYSDFLAARHMGKSIPSCTFDKVSNALFIPMEFSDAFTSEIVWRMYYNSFLKKVGNNNHLQAAQMADQAAIDTMASKTTGNKGKLYNSAIGGMMLQFTQEAYNNLVFIFGGGLAAYSGAYNDSSRRTKYSGFAKALASLLLMLAGNHFIDKFSGRDIAIDPYGSWEKAQIGSKGKASASDVASNALTNLVSSMNPVSNIIDLENLDSPSINLLKAPAPSAVIDTASSLKDFIVGAGGAMFDYLQGNEVSTDWMGNITDAALNWVPAGASIKRFADTAKAASQGYASSSGKYKVNGENKMKFPFEPTLGNIAKSAAFGTNSIDAAKEYVASGYKAVSEDDYNEIMSMSAFNGDPVWKSYYNHQEGKRAKELSKQSDFAQKTDQNFVTPAKEAKEARQNAGTPTNLSPYVEKYKNSKWTHDAIDIWKETGEDVLPKEIEFQTGEVNGTERTYFEYKNKAVFVSPSDMEKMNEDYVMSSAMIIAATKDPAEIKKRQKSALNKIKDQYYAKMYGGD